MRQLPGEAARASLTAAQIRRSWLVGVPAAALLDGVQEAARLPRTSTSFGRRARLLGWKTNGFGWERWQPFDLLSTVDAHSKVPRWLLPLPEARL